MEYLDISDKLKTFLSNTIDSVGQLEVLLFFLNSSSKAFNAEEVSKHLRSNTKNVLNQMTRLSRSELLKKVKEPDTFIYHPQTELLHNLVLELQQMFTIRPTKIIAFIYDRPKDKLQDFAEAFRFKKD